MVGKRYVAGVSWPRSGHHLMERLVQNYFGESFRYCFFYRDDPACCHTFPCTQAGVNFTKYHDFELSGRIVEGVPYLVQYRALTPATISDFELYLRDDGDVGEDTVESFRAFARYKADGWAAFMAKWVDAQFPTERLLVRYEDFVSDAHGVLRSAIPFFAPGEVLNEERLNHVIDTEHHVAVSKQNGVEWRLNAGVKAFRKPESFRFYDANFFRELEAYADEKRWRIGAAGAATVGPNWRRPSSAMQLLRSSASKLKRLMS